MTRPSQLPPRSPLMNRGLIRHGSLDSAPGIGHGDGGFGGHRQMFPFHGPFVSDEQPLWHDDLLADPENSPVGLSIRRASSDPVKLLQMAVSYNGPMLPVSEEAEEVVLDGSVEISKENDSASDSGYVLEADSCVYGPNSPRQIDKPANSESSIVSSLLESFPRNPLQYVTAGCSNAPKASDFNGNDCVNTNANDTDPTKLYRRHSGQRSRVRKIQYIAELERRVEMLQSLSADLAARAASLFQNRVVLSAENKKLRQQISSLQHRKIIKDGEYQSLKKEADVIRGVPAGHRRSRSEAACSDMDSLPSAFNWQMIDMAKLNLGRGPIRVKPISRT